MDFINDRSQELINDSKGLETKRQRNLETRKKFITEVTGEQIKYFGGVPFWVRLSIFDHLNFV